MSEINCYIRGDNGGLEQVYEVLRTLTRVELREVGMICRADMKEVVEQSCVVVSDKGFILGCNMEGTECEIVAAVVPDFRKKGIMRELAGQLAVLCISTGDCRVGRVNIETINEGVVTAAKEMGFDETVRDGRRIALTRERSVLGEESKTE